MQLRSQKTGFEVNINLTSQLSHISHFLHIVFLHRFDTLIPECKEK
jgi:hypothetical protein